MRDESDTDRFVFHGVAVRVTCRDAEIRARIREDFLWFRRPAPADAELSLTVHVAEPDWASVPPLPATLHSPRNVCYRDGAVTWLDYFSRALARWDRDAGTFEVWSVRPHLLHEIVYLTVLSRVGEALERRGLHRVHALGLARGGAGALFLFPSGGGKTTLALEALTWPTGEQLLSEDSPLVDRDGLLYPFPLRLGVLSDTPPPYPPELLTYAERMEFRPKWLISLRAFPDRIAEKPVPARLLVLGRRTLGRTCAIRPARLRDGLRALMKDMVVGVGLYQGVEFLMQTSGLDLARYAPLYVSRLRTALALLRETEVYWLEAGRDTAANARAVHELLDSRLPRRVA